MSLERRARRNVRRAFAPVARVWPSLSLEQREVFLLKLRPAWSAMFAGLPNLHDVRRDLAQLIPADLLPVMLHAHDEWRRGEWAHPDVTPPVTC